MGFLTDFFYIHSFDMKLSEHIQLGNTFFTFISYFCNSNINFIFFCEKRQPDWVFKKLSKLKRFTFFNYTHSESFMLKRSYLKKNKINKPKYPTHGEIGNWELMFVFKIHFYIFLNNKSCFIKSNFWVISTKFVTHSKCLFPFSQKFKTNQYVPKTL